MHRLLDDVAVLAIAAWTLLGFSSLGSVVAAQAKVAASPKTGPAGQETPEAAGLPAKAPPAAPVLCIPAMAGDLARVQALIKKGADVNAADEIRRTPLMLALARYTATPGSTAPKGKPISDEQRLVRKLKVARLLLERGADVRRRSEIGMTALHYAAMLPGEESTALEWVRDLVKRGAEVDVPMVAGTTPLRMAVDRRRSQVARFLIESGANPRIPDNDEQTPLRRAKELGMSDVLQAAAAAPVAAP